MAYAGILDLVNFYTQRSNDLTSEIVDIMQDINESNRGSINFLKDVAAQKSELKNRVHDTDSDEYKDALEDITNNYQIKLAEIQQWETELESEKSQKETELQSINGYKESYEKMLKQNIDSDLKYGQS